MNGATPTNYRDRLRSCEPKTTQPTSPARQSTLLPTVQESSTPSTADSEIQVINQQPFDPLDRPTPQLLQEMALLPQVRLDAFTGDENASAWWQDYLNFTNVYGCTDLKKCQLLPLYLKGTAKLWHTALPETVRLNLKDLETAFASRFTQKTGFDVSILQMTQTPAESASQFVTRVQSAMCHLNLPDTVMVGVAVNGLLPAIKQTVYNREPNTLEHVRRYASLAEKAIASSTLPSDHIAAKVDNLATLVASLLTQNSSQSQAANVSTAVKRDTADGPYQPAVKRRGRQIPQVDQRMSQLQQPTMQPWIQQMPQHQMLQQLPQQQMPQHVPQQQMLQQLPPQQMPQQLPPQQMLQQSPPQQMLQQLPPQQMPQQLPQQQMLQQSPQQQMPQQSPQQQLKQQQPISQVMMPQQIPQQQAHKRQPRQPSYVIPPFLKNRCHSCVSLLELPLHW